MNKKGLFGLLIIILVLVIVGFFWFVKIINDGKSILEAPECTVDSDCIPDSCCHAKSCTAISNAPKCDGTFCTENCEPDTLDCGQGSCGCFEGKCIVNFEE